MKNKTVLITGITGLIGSELARALHSRGWVIYSLSTREKLPEAIAPLVTALLTWDKRYTINRPELLRDVAAVVHLAGANVAGKRWNAAYKQEILESRTRSTEALYSAFRSLGAFPSVFVGASATGFYGSREDETLTEASAKGQGFLSDVCIAWEEAAKQFSEAGSRWVGFRTGIIMSTKGGALPQMLLPFRLFVGGPLGSGQQWFSWISLDDAVAAFVQALEEPSFAGIYNLVAPVPLRMGELARAMGKTMHRPSFFPVPGFVLRLVMGESAFEITKSQRVLPERLSAANFQFKHPEIGSALGEIIAGGR
jgi:hypothetical protein